MSDDLKKQAALAALDEIRNGMIVGLGTGSTAAHFIRALGSRARDGLKVVGIPTSEDSARLAKEAGVPLTTFRDHPEIDITVDGADEAQPPSVVGQPPPELRAHAEGDDEAEQQQSPDREEQSEARGGAEVEEGGMDGEPDEGEQRQDDPTAQSLEDDRRERCR